jgi:hypothetical protein
MKTKQENQNILLSEFDKFVELSTDLRTRAIYIRGILRDLYSDQTKSKSICSCGNVLSEDEINVAGECQYCRKIL